MFKGDVGKNLLNFTVTISLDGVRIKILTQDAIHAFKIS